MLGVPAPRFFAEGSPSLGVIEGENWLMLLMAVTVDVGEVGNARRPERGSVDMTSSSSGRRCDDSMCQ